MRYFTLKLLREACKTAYMHEFNQTIARKWLKDLPADGRFPVIYAQPHTGSTRAAGELTDVPHNYPHIRCLVQMPDGMLRQDVTEDLYDRLPEMAGDVQITARPVTAAELLDRMGASAEDKARLLKAQE